METQTNPTNEKHWQIRAVVPGDISFIYSTWLKSYKHHSPLTRYTPSNIFYKEHQTVIDRILASGRAVISIACDREDSDVIYGYLVHEPGGVVHFIYVKESFRHMGIAHHLFESQEIDLTLPISITHISSALTDRGNPDENRPPRELCLLWRAGTIKLTFNPYLLERRPD